MPTVESVRCDAVLSLGKKLTEELGFDKSPSTLGRWMAHYIAELMDAAEKANLDERPAKMQACYEAILKLWRCGYWQPNGRRPFEHLEPVMNVLARLDIQNEYSKYSYRVNPDTGDEVENKKITRWLNIVEGVDDSAKMLIRYFLLQAAHSGLPKSNEWIRLAKAAGIEEGAESRVANMLSDEQRLFKASELSDKDRKLIEERINRLEWFAKAATALVAELRRENPGDESNNDDAEDEQPDPEIPDDPEVDVSMNQQS